MSCRSMHLSGIVTAQEACTYQVIFYTKLKWGGEVFPCLPLAESRSSTTFMGSEIVTTAGVLQ